jgi:PAS domain S-box-containing protein
MTGKSVKNPSDSWCGDAQLPVNQLLDEIEVLRDSEARFRAIFENAAVGIARVALDDRWLEVNQRLCDIVGYSREDLMTKTFDDLTYPDDLEQDVKEARRLSDGEIDTYVMEKRYYRKDSSVVWANLTVSMARKADGSPDYFISVIEDISARKQAEEKLRESEERFRTMVSAFPGFSFETDIDGNNVFSSDQWSAYTGMTAEETAGAGFAGAIHPEEANAVLAQ